MRQQILAISIILAADDPRVHCGDLHREIAGELLEIIASGDEVGLTVDLDQHADPSTTVNVGLDESLLRDTVALLVGDDRALCLQDLLRLLEVATCLGQGALAIHDTRAGHPPESADFVG